MEFTWTPICQQLALSILFASILLAFNMITMKYLKTRFELYKPMIYFSIIGILACLFGFYALYSLEPMYYKAFLALFEIAILPIYFFFSEENDKPFSLVLDVIFLWDTLILITLIYQNRIETMIIDGYLILIRSKTNIMVILKTVKMAIFGFMMIYYFISSPSFGRGVLRTPKFLVYALVFLTAGVLLNNYLYASYSNIYIYVIYSLIIVDIASIFAFFPSIFITSHSEAACLLLLDRNGVLLKKILARSMDMKFLSNIIVLVMESIEKIGLNVDGIYLNINGFNVASNRINGYIIAILGKNLKRDLTKYMSFISAKFDRNIEKVWYKLAEIYGLGEST